MGLVSLVYVSFATHDMSDEELQELLKIAREKNSALAVTGMLLYRDRYFIQALEGEEAVVDTLYEKIKQDPRHMSALIVMKTNIKDRSFEQWSMGFNKVDTHEVKGFTDFLDTPFEHAYFEEHPTRAVALLEQFRDRTFF
jgi:hypothetical protein